MQACRERVRELAVRLPKLQADASKAAQDMAAAQQQSEDADITDEGREALLERIQGLTAAETEVKEGLADAEQVQQQRSSSNCSLVHSFINRHTR